jgi:hypothetical protein
MRSQVRGAIWPLWGGGEALPMPRRASVTTRRREADAPGGGPLAGRWPVRERPRRVSSRSRARELVASPVEKRYSTVTVFARLRG